MFWNFGAVDPATHSPDSVPDAVDTALPRGTAALLTAASIWRT